MSCLRTYLTSVALTAMASQDETSELFIGEWMEMRGIRNQVFVATKVCFIRNTCNTYVLTRVQQYTTNYKLGEGPDFGPRVMYNGNNIKSMHVSVEESLKKLRTTYIDILYVHWVSIDRRCAEPSHSFRASGTRTRASRRS